MRYAEAGALRASRMAAPPASTTQKLAIRRAALSAIPWLIPRSSGQTSGLQLGVYLIQKDSETKGSWKGLQWII